MLRLASGTDMQVSLVAQNSRRLHRRILIVLRKFLKSVEGLLIDKISLLDPALDPAGSANFSKTLLPVDNLEALAVFHIADTVVDRSNLITQCRLRRRNITHLEHMVAIAAARGKGKQAGQNQRGPLQTG